MVDSFARRARSHRYALALVLASGLAAACGDDEKKSSDAQVDAGSGDGSVPSGPDASLDAATDARAADATTDARRDATSDGSNTPVAPTLTMALARQVGRFGESLRIDVSASDANKDIAAVVLTLKNAAMAPIGGERTIPLAVAITTVEGNSYALLEDLFRNGAGADVASVSVALIDGMNQRSEAMELTVTRQPLVQLGGACDATFVQNRCADMLGCKGVPSTCQMGAPPVLMKLGYYDDILGRRIMLEGDDPDGDVVKYTVRFLDANDAPIGLDLDNDEVADELSYEGTIEPTSSGTAFFALFEPDEEFVRVVKKVDVDVTDSGGRKSNVLRAPLSMAPQINTGAACDPRGFNRCNTGSVCTTTGSVSRCTAIATARMTAANAALVLRPEMGVTSVRGAISRPSLWDAPEGCSFAQPGQPDAVVKLLLTQPATRVVITTDLPYTAFDSELYVLQAASDAPSLYDPRTPGSMDFWCASDQPAPTRDPQAKLELKNLTAGDYFIIVDSFPASDATGTGFQLDVTVE